MDTFKYPTVKEFWVGLTPYEKGMQGHNEAQMREATNNHPELIDLNDRFENHISIKDYKDAATNMRLILEYMVKQYSQEYAPDLYHESIAAQTEKLLERNIINVSTKGDYDKLRKLGNALGAHIANKKVKVNEVRECCYLISKLEADFLKCFIHRAIKRYLQGIITILLMLRILPRIVLIEIIQTKIIIIQMIIFDAVILYIAMGKHTEYLKDRN